MVELPPDDVLLDMFPFTPSGRYIVNIAEHGMPDVPYDEDAEMNMHLDEIAMYIDHIMETKNISLSEALARLKEDYSYFEKEDPVVVPAPPGCFASHYQSIVKDQLSVDDKGKEEDVPVLSDELRLLNIVNSAIESIGSGSSSSTFPDNPMVDRDKLISIAGMDTLTKSPSLTPEQKATFNEGWDEEEAKLILSALNVQTRKFTFQNRRVMLTYKTFIDKEKLREFIRTQASAPDAVIDIAHETGDKVCPYYHTHAVVDFGKRFQSQNVRILDYGNIHPHILPIPNETRYARARHYLSKEDPECSYLFNPNIASSLATRVWSCVTLQEALRQHVHCPSDTSGIVQMYQLRSSDPSRLRYEEPTYPWQQDLLSKVKDPIVTSKDKRSVIWLYDDVGNTGKSQFCRYLRVTMPQKWYVVSGIVGSRDIATIISNACASGWNGHGIIFDIPRVESERDIAGRNSFSELMKSIELIKNGMLTASKYNGHSVEFNQGWIIVMSNGLPNVYEVSVDRWEIYEIFSTDKSMRYIPYQEAHRRKMDLLESKHSVSSTDTCATNNALTPC